LTKIATIRKKIKHLNGENRNLHLELISVDKEFVIPAGVYLREDGGGNDIFQKFCPTEIGS